MLCLCSQTYCSFQVTSSKFEFSSKSLNERVLELELSGARPLKKYRRVLKEKVYVTSNKRGFQTNNHYSATYEKIEKSLFHFYPKRIVESDRILTEPLNL